MLDPITDALNDIFDDMDVDANPWIDTAYFQEKLEAYGFMIVPIEDPTNLRYGDEDD